MTLPRLSSVTALLIALSAAAAAQDRTNTVQFKFDNPGPPNVTKATDLHVVFDQHIQSLVTHNPATQQDPANTFPDHSGDNTVTHDFAVGVNGAGVAAGKSVTLTFSWATGKAPKIKSWRWTKTNTLTPNPNDPNDWLGLEVKPKDMKNQYQSAPATGGGNVRVQIDGTDHHFYSVAGDTAEQSALRFGDFINSLPFGCTLWTSGNEVAYTGLSYSPEAPNIVVDVIQQDSTQFVTVTDITDAPGDTCTLPIVVTLPAQSPYTDANQYTCGRPNVYEGTCLGSYDNAPALIYSLVVTGPECLSITATGNTSNNNYIGIAVDSACPPGAACIAYGTSSSGTVATISNLSLAAGTYTLMVSNWAPGPDCLTDFTVTITECPLPPPNDNCDGAILLPVPSYVVASNALATNDVTPTCGTTTPVKGLWYKFIGTGNAVTVTTCDAATAFDTKIQVFCDCPATACVAGNDDDPNCSLSTLDSTVTFCSLLGHEYYIIVGGYSGAGTFGLSVTDDSTACPAPTCIVAACCLPNGSCQMLTATACAAAYGTWQGAYVECASVQCQPCDPCPPNGYPEGEPVCSDGYVDNYNGGCNSSPYVFSPISCGSTVCGTFGTFLFGTSQCRDTDWYEFVATSSMIYEWRVTAEFPVLVGVIDGTAGCPVSEFLVYATGAPCVQTTVTTNPLPAGTYWLFVAPSVFTGVPCGSNYIASLSCTEVLGACCHEGPCQVMTPADCAASGGLYLGDNTTCTPNPCPPGLCPGDTNCDGRVTFADIDPFVEALSGQSAWNQHHPNCPWLNADCNHDGMVNFADIDPFVARIGTTCP